MKPYDIERIVLGTVLKYGNPAAQSILPQLTPDKFIFGVSGEFGIDHSVIWETIAEKFLNDKENPTLFEIWHVLGDEYREELKSLVDDVSKMYLIDELEIQSLMALAEIVHKQGIVFNTSTHARKLANLTGSQDVFNRTVDSIEDIEQWINVEISVLRENAKVDIKGYTHVSTVVESVIEYWERQRRGEQLVLLPVGMPSLMLAHLFPVRKTAVLHGLSGMGKSAFVHQVNLGTAIGLVANHLPGCVAINSLEMEQGDLVERMVSTLAHVDTNKLIDGKMSDSEFTALIDWAEFVAHLPLYIDDTNFLTTSAMEYRATGLHVSEHGPVMQLSSDYGELFKDTEGESKEQRIDHVFRQQFFLSRNIGASVIAVSQSTSGDKTNSKSGIAGADGTRYSRGILQSADILCELWNPVQMEVSGRTFVAPDNLSATNPWLLIEKYRKGGKPCAIPLGWKAEYTAFFDLGFQQNVGQEIIFNHIDAALEAMNLGARLLPIEDSPLNDIGW